APLNAAAEEAFRNQLPSGTDLSQVLPVLYYSKGILPDFTDLDDGAFLAQAAHILLLSFDKVAVMDMNHQLKTLLAFLLSA
ncbi:hypothetical protein RZS08_48015, partial [Arthrospira platensis SPKY1]|nr:hypothetical protein [Arthrospira platensis SPKY1]